jgi:hypothetical protein
MAQTLFRDLQLKEATQERVQGDAYLFEERNPLDETKLREIETELTALTGCTKADRVKITVLGLEDFQRAVRRIVPKRLIDRGLAAHVRVLHDPRDPHHVIIGPSALAGLNDGHANVVTDLLYHLIAATGKPSNQAFERGIADLLAREIADRLGLDVFSDHYPEERAFVEALLEASKPDLDDDLMDTVGVFKKNPKTVYNAIYDSSFYDWWANSVARDDALSAYVDLLRSMTAPNAQLEGSFMLWARQCAEAYRDFRLEQQRKGKLSAAKRRAEQA